MSLSVCTACGETYDIRTTGGLHCSLDKSPIRSEVIPQDIREQANELWAKMNQDLDNILASLTLNPTGECTDCLTKRMYG